jgi:hypothetical protein
VFLFLNLAAIFNIILDEINHLPALLQNMELLDGSGS